MHNGMELRYSIDDGEFTIQILSLEDTLVYYDWYPFLNDLGKVLFFATDGDISYFYSDLELHKPGIYKLEVSLADWDYAEYVAESIHAMLVGGFGWLNSDSL